MNPTFPSYWDLSDTTSVRWLAGGTLRFSRQKMDILGRKKETAYKVYVKPLTYVAILGKMEEIEKKMLELVEGGTSLLNINLHDDSIIQLSLFQKNPRKPEEREPYYGIHRVDLDDEIVPGVGINLNQDEYVNFIEMLMQWRAGFKAKDYVDATKGKPLKKKRRVQYEGAHAPATASTSPYRSVQITCYGWEWYLSGSEPLRSRSQGYYFVNPKNCLKQAVEKKPEGDFQLETFAKKDTMEIDGAMFDSAYGYLLVKNILYCKAENGFAFPKLDIEEDFQIYGGKAWERISITDVYNLVKDLIETHQKFDEDMKIWIMNKLALHSTNEDAVAYYAKEMGYHGLSLCDELFQYINE